MDLIFIWLRCSLVFGEEAGETLKQSDEISWLGYTQAAHLKAFLAFPLETQSGANDFNMGICL